MHKRDQESILISTLAEGHTITAACTRAGVSRMFYDRHYKSDRNFRKQVDEARSVGMHSNEDLVSTMHMKKVRDGHWPAIRYAIDKKTTMEKEEKEDRRDPNSVHISPGDIRFLIDALPEPLKSRNYIRLREILDDSSAAQQAGQLIDPRVRAEMKVAKPPPEKPIQIDDL